MCALRAGKKTQKNAHGDKERRPLSTSLLQKSNPLLSEFCNPSYFITPIITWTSFSVFVTTGLSAIMILHSSLINRLGILEIWQKDTFVNPSWRWMCPSFLGVCQSIEDMRIHKLYFLKIIYFILKKLQKKIKGKKQERERPSTCLISLLEQPKVCCCEAVSQELLLGLPAPARPSANIYVGRGDAGTQTDMDMKYGTADKTCLHVPLC